MGNLGTQADIHTHKNFLWTQKVMFWQLVCSLFKTCLFLR